MFFIIGISNGEKKLDFVQTMVCSRCGQFGRLEVFMTYMYFNLFFIPIFRWNRRYYAKSSCCDTVYQIDPAIGARIRKGEQVTLQEEYLQEVRRGRDYSGHTGYDGQAVRPKKRCPACGYMAAEDFDFCPKCGTRL